MLRLLLKAWDVRVSGSENVPADGPVVLVANHAGAIDGAVVLMATRRPVHVVARSESFGAPLDATLRRLGQLPLVEGVSPRTALRAAVEHLRAGRVVATLPEGRAGRGDVGRSGPETAYLLAHGDAIVVPVALLGTRGDGRPFDSVPKTRARIDVVVGEPFRPSIDGDVRRRVVLTSVAERIRQELADHVAASARTLGRRLPALPGEAT